jgi:HSP20 family protein
MNSQLQTSETMQPREQTGDAASRELATRDQPHIVPPVDVFEDDSGITLLADLPGASRERLGVRVDGDSLLIEASASTAGPEDMQLLHEEAPYPSYRRQFTLSRELDATRIEASLKDGVLRLTIPKLEEAKPRRIEVRAG